MLTIRFIVLGLFLGLSAFASAQEPEAIPVWPEKTKDLTPGKLDRFISEVRMPTMAVYLPPAEKATGAAVVICPGGGYSGVAIDREGHDVARWLNSICVAGIVLKYRMPRPAETVGQVPWPLQDARQAIRITRQNAEEWKLDPARIGIMGFSAGGHLASTVGTHLDEGQSKSADPLARLSARPDFMILIYPVISFRDEVGHTGSRNNLLGRTPDPKLIEEYSNELRVTPRTPPTFGVHTKDDGVKIANSILFHEALKKEGVPSRLEIYEKGGHGYGLGTAGGDVATWPARCEEWMKSMKLLERGK